MKKGYAEKFPSSTGQSNPDVASNPNDPSPLIPLPARCTSLACTDAGRGQGGGQVSLRMKALDRTEKMIAFSFQRWIVHASNAFYATPVLILAPVAHGSR